MVLLKETIKASHPECPSLRAINLVPFSAQKLSNYLATVNNAVPIRLTMSLWAKMITQDQSDNPQTESCKDWNFTEQTVSFWNSLTAAK